MSEEKEVNIEINEMKKKPNKPIYPRLFCRTSLPIILEKI